MTLIEIITEQASVHEARTSRDRAALVDSSADVVMGTPTFFLAGVGVAQLIVTTLD
ncbi:hypothetical protein [Curtobacterium flaccumfaciens]|uniref:hypothetical protein n=1 Tax=Curtobacterium flaccumfaciens TaxID=2035 RepID=UPI001367322B|nr:hypothetical protein [Curtobacterium flaccumfaciens]MBT1666338.1 hypothetical protein [Curtobacterium flaccumfaciens pv. flaccumfaciens]QHN62526.1 hypothetical protein GBG65_19480 [Curtobacterium flaccumfaciens pv. flaccumfaciens]